MSEDPQQHRERKRFGWWIAVVVAVLPVLYVLSPPIVMLFLGGQVFFDIDWVYQPLQQLSRSSDLFASCYAWYFGLFPGDFWFAWNVSSELSRGAGGLGPVIVLP